MKQTKTNFFRRWESDFKSCNESLMLSQFIKKNKKQLIENYHPILLLPVCGKILEWIIYNKMFTFFSVNELISHNHSGFKPGDSALINDCVSPTIFINHLMMASRQKASFLIYPRHLIKFGMRDFSPSWSKMVYQVTF